MYAVEQKPDFNAAEYRAARDRDYERGARVVTEAEKPLGFAFFKRAL